MRVGKVESVFGAGVLGPPDAAVSPREFY